VKKILEKINTENYSLMSSYRNIFENGKFIYNNFLDEFLHKDFFVGKNKNYDKLNNKLTPEYLAEQNKIKDLKNGFIKLTMIMSFYENIIFDSLTKINIDINRFQLQEKFQEQSNNKINELQGIFSLYSDLLEDLNNLRQSEKLDFNTTHIDDKSCLYENNLLKSYHKNSKNIRKIVNVGKKLNCTNSNLNLFNTKREEASSPRHNITNNHNYFYQNNVIYSVEMDKTDLNFDDDKIHNENILTNKDIDDHIFSDKDLISLDPKKVGIAGDDRMFKNPRIFSKVYYKISY